MSLNTWAIKCIKKYQKNKEIIGSGRCKHYPSCSNYAIGCYEKFNFIKASFLMIFRIIRCNPLTKKVYDPVPLTKKEKKQLKQQRQYVLSFMPTLAKQFSICNELAIKDYITLIYESTFGPYYLKEQLLTKEDCLFYLTSLVNDSFKMENIGNDYHRLYITKDLATMEMAEVLYNSIQESDMSDVKIQVFNEKLYLLKQMIKKKEINLNYEESYDYIESYLTCGIKYLGHSDIYKENNSINYIVTKREK